MTSSLVLDLQKDAIDSNLAVTDLLRKAKVAAKKLRVADFEEWIDSELFGYEEADTIPPYRRLRGELRASTPLSWISTVRSARSGHLPETYLPTDKLTDQRSPGSY